MRTRFQGMLATEKSKGMGDQEERMDLADEVDMGGKVRVCPARYSDGVVHWFITLSPGFDARARRNVDAAMVPLTAQRSAVVMVLLACDSLLW